MGHFLGGGGETLVVHVYSLDDLKIGTLNQWFLAWCDSAHPCPLLHSQWEYIAMSGDMFGFYHFEKNWHLVDRDGDAAEHPADSPPQQRPT